jgi:hypothetical protein
MPKGLRQIRDLALLRRALQHADPTSKVETIEAMDRIMEALQNGKR